MADNGGCVGRISLVFLTLCIGVFFALGVTFFSLNFDGRTHFKPYVSDRFELPFPSLFEEFELDSKRAVKSGINKTRGTPESCRRRLAPEYETYRLGSSGVLEYVPSKRFVVDGDMPPGWLSYTLVESSAVVILDGCRLDYALYDPSLTSDEPRAVFTNHMPLFHEFLENAATRSRARIFRFVSPIPTFTVYSIKCMYTGESRRGNMMGQSTATTMLDIDNIGNQFVDNRERLCVIGELVSADLFGHDRLFFDRTAKGTDIYDLTVPDCNVYDNYQESLDTCDLSVMHLLAIDHLGHAGKRVSPAMTYYLDEYDILLRKIIEHFHRRKNAMFFALGDHGQNTSGSHGGASRGETDAALFIISDLELHDVEHQQCSLDDAPIDYAKDHNVLNGRIPSSYPLYKNRHTNLAVTLCLLMNKPIPYHSYGSPIKEAIPLIKNADGIVNEELTLKYMTQLLHVVSHQTLRTLDTTISDDDKHKYRRIYSEVQRERIALSHYYSYIRSMGRKKLKLKDMREIYGAYMKQCDRLLSVSGRMLEITGMAMNPEYMVTAVLLCLLSCLLLTYLFLAAWRIYHVKHISVSDVALFEGQKFTSVGRIAFRALWKLVLSMILAAAFAKHIEYVDEEQADKKAGKQVTISIFKRFIGHFEQLCGVDEQPMWFHLAVYTALLFAILFLFDIPFFIRSYRFLYREGVNLKETVEPPLPEYAYGGHMKAFLALIPKWNPIRFIGLLFIILVIMTIGSQCAIISHDMLLRHILVISLYFALFPFLCRVGSLKLDGAYRNFGFVLFMVKVSYLLHAFFVAREVGKMLHWWYVMVQDLMRTFEVPSTALTLFYITLLVFLRGGSLPYQGENMTSPSRELYKSPVSGLFLRAAWTVQYILLLLHYAVKSERHYFFDHVVTETCLRVTGMNNILNAKKMLGVQIARVSLLFTMSVLVALLTNPGGILYKTKGSPHRRSSALFWSTVNLIWTALLINGPRKAATICLFAFMLYNMVSLMVKLRIRSRGTCIILFIYTSDLMYFVIGHQDSVFELDFDALYLFFENYNGWPCNVAVVLAFAICNITTFFSLFYLFLLEGERRYASLHDSKEVAESGSPEDAEKSLEADMKSVLNSNMLYTVVGYSCMACVQITFTVSLLFLLINNMCAVSDFYPKGVFNIGKMVANLTSFWVLYCIA